MSLDLSGYPPTKAGAWEMIEALTPNIVSLWRFERKQQSTDDLIVVVNARSNLVKVDNRLTVLQQIKKRSPTLDLLDHVSKKPTTSNGSICVWVIIGFQTGQLCCLPFTIAYS
jgi:hypothetical protein